MHVLTTWYSLQNAHVNDALKPLLPTPLSLLAASSADAHVDDVPRPPLISSPRRYRHRHPASESVGSSEK